MAGRLRDSSGRRRRAMARRANARACAIASSNQRAARDDLDERAALDRADERRPAPRQRALVVRHAGIEIARRAGGAATGMRTRRPARHSPICVGAERADDGDEDAARGTLACSGRSGGLGGSGAGRRADDIASTATLSETPAASERRVGAQHALDDRERFVVFGQPATVERRPRARSRARAASNASAQRRPPRALPCDRRPAARRRRRIRAATATASHQRTRAAPGPQRTGDAGGDQQREARTNGGLRNEKAGGGAGEQTEGGNGGDGAHARGAVQPITPRSTHEGHESTRKP